MVSKTEKPKYLKFSRSFDNGGKAPWLTFYMRGDIEFVSEIKAICDKCKKEEKLAVSEGMDYGKLLQECELKHQKCGLC